MRIAIAPLAAPCASSICTVVAGSISSVDPSKKETIAWLRSAVCTRSPVLTMSPSDADTNAAAPRATDAVPSRIERIVDALDARCCEITSAAGTTTSAAITAAIRTRRRPQPFPTR